MSAGHVSDCAGRRPQSYCRGCYGERTHVDGLVGERRPRTMAAAYAALPPKALVRLAEYRARMRARLAAT